MRRRGYLTPPTEIGRRVRRQRAPRERSDSTRARRYVHNGVVPAIGRLRYLEATPPATERPRGVVVLLHAFPLNARMWEGQLALADARLACHCAAVRGFDGGAGDPPTASIGRLRRRRHRSARRAAHQAGGHRRPVDGRLRGVRDAAPRAALFSGARSSPTRGPQADTPEGLEGRKRMLQLVRDKGAGRRRRRDDPEAARRNDAADAARGRRARAVARARRARPTRSPAPSAR